MLIRYVFIIVSSLYTTAWIRKLYKSQLRGLRLIYKVTVLACLVSFFSSMILLLDILVGQMIKSKSDYFFSYFQNEYLVPCFVRIFPNLAYFAVIATFYVLSATVVDTLVHNSVECYIKNYESKPQKITFMCFNILSQVLLLSIGYFSLFVTMIKLTTWDQFVWDDSGFLIVISSILAGAVKFPQRTNSKWNDIVINSYAIFFSIKLWITLVKTILV